jgi:hypothetical protein
VSLRDGLQNENAPLSLSGKLRLVDALVASGLRRIEITSFVSPRWSPSSTMASFEETIGPAREAGMRLRGYVSTVWGCPYEGSVEPARSIAIARRLYEMGCSQVSLGDTIGARAAGNVATEDLVYMLEGMGVCTGVDLERLVEAARAVEGIVGRPLLAKVHRASIRSLRAYTAFSLLQCHRGRSRLAAPKMRKSYPARWGRGRRVCRDLQRRGNFSTGSPHSRSQDGHRSHPPTLCNHVRVSFELERNRTLAPRFPRCSRMARNSLDSGRHRVEASPPRARTRCHFFVLWSPGVARRVLRAFGPEDGRLRPTNSQRASWGVACESRAP